MRATSRAFEGGLIQMGLERFFNLGPYSMAAGARARPWRLIAFIALLYLAVPLLGIAVFWTHLDQARQETFENLVTVAEFKKRELEQWLRTRTGDAEEVTTRVVLADLVARWIAHGDVAAKNLVAERLSALHTIKGFQSVVLAGPDGQVLMGFGDDHSISDATGSGPLRQAADSGRVVRSAIYRDGAGRTRIDFLAPLKRRANGGEGLVGVVVLRVDAEAELFPMVARWPTRSESAETALIRRDGDAVLFMTPLRHRNAGPFSLRVPLSDEDLPAAIFARNPEKQSTEGRDYRGVAVLAAQAPVNAGEWQVLVKVDRSEVVAPLVDLSAALAIQAGGAVTVVSLLLVMLWRAERRSHDLDMAMQAAEKDRFLARFFDMPFLGLALANRDRTLLHANSRLCEILGCSKEDLLQTRWTQWTHPDDRDASRTAYQRLVNGHDSHISLQKRYVRKDGGIVPSRLDIQVIRDANGAVDCFLVLVEDISASRKAEIALRESEVRYQALMDNSADGIVIADPEGRILEINRTGEQILGYSKAQIRSMVLRDLFPREYWDLHAAALGECLATGHGEVRNAVAVRQDGGHVSLDIRAAMVQLESGPVLQGVFNDVSERQRQQKERRRAEEAHRSALATKGGPPALPGRQ